MPPVEGHVANTVRRCIDVLCSLQKNSRSLMVYQEKLEPPLLDKSRRFYGAEGKLKLEFSSTPENLNLCRYSSWTHTNAFFTYGPFIGGQTVY